MLNMGLLPGGGADRPRTSPSRDPAPIRTSSCNSAPRLDNLDKRRVGDATSSPRHARRAADERRSLARPNRNCCKKISMAISLGLDVASVCGKCKQPMPSADQFCPACGADRHVEARIAALELTRLAQARKWILWIGIWYVISALVAYLQLQDRLTPRGTLLLFGVNVGLCAIHLGLYVWARRAPLAAAIVALILFVSLHVANAVLDPDSIDKGIVLKVVFVAILIKAIQAGYQIHRLRNERV
ncbi:MAG TPA: zinc ribbon domain-containing protein [Kofleriaceae bacterium]|nr:zinc ribbon domain-containing protein [Kofleriaceae bacterium]